MLINNHIILIGFMGTGKTTVGIELAKFLSINYFDTDQEIEKIVGKRIREIFAEKGEKYFRKLETDKLIELTKKNTPSVISTGGGIVLSAKNRLILERFPTILLQATPEEIHARVKDNLDRPLLNNGNDLLSQITDLLNQRQDLYEQSSKFVIGTGNKEIAEIIKEIENFIKEYKNNSSDYVNNKK